MEAPTGGAAIPGKSFASSSGDTELLSDNNGFRRMWPTTPKKVRRTSHPFAPLLNACRGYAGEVPRQIARKLRGPRNNALKVEGSPRILLSYFLRYLGDAGLTEEKLDRLLNQARHPEFLPRFLEAAKIPHEGRARYWLYRMFGVKV